MISLTQKYLKECLSYNKETGIFTRIKRPLYHFDCLNNCNKFNKKMSGKIVGTNNGDGYLTVMINGKNYRLHRLAWLYVYGVFPEQVDHINGVRHDNRINNLRDATNKQNMQNQKKARKDNNCGLIGVSFNKRVGKFYSRIKKDGVTYFLGSFDTKEDANKRYLEKKREIHEFNTL